MAPKGSISELHTLRQEKITCNGCQNIYDAKVVEGEWFEWTRTQDRLHFCSTCLEYGSEWNEYVLLLYLAGDGFGSPVTMQFVQRCLRFSEAEESSGLIEGSNDNRSLRNENDNKVATLKEVEFNYTPLASGQIRLLRLMSGPDDKIRCTLENIQLDSNIPEYCALSYCWGDPNQKPSNVLVNGAEFPVLPNLRNALQDLRKQGKDWILWVDAICIKQKDEREKTTQLPIMGRIYREAASVLIWLGPGDAEVQSTVGHIRDRNVAAMSSNAFRQAMYALCRRDWFSRTWIIQEFAANKRSPLLLIGDCPPLIWAKFQAAYLFAVRSSSMQLSANTSSYSEGNIKLLAEEYLNTLDAASADLHNAWAENVTWLTETRAQVQIDGGTMFERPLLKLMWQSRMFNATEPKDKVYGLRGLIPEERLQHIPADYEKDVAEIYQNATQYMLMFEEGVQLYLRFPLSTNLPTNNHKLPSWVPDFSSKAIAMETAGEPHWFFLGPFRPHNFDFAIVSEADRHAPQGPKPKIRPVFHGSSLSSQGVFIDVIDEVKESRVASTHSTSDSRKTTEAFIRRISANESTVNKQERLDEQLEDQNVHMILFPKLIQCMQTLPDEERTELVALLSEHMEFSQSANEWAQNAELGVIAPIEIIDMPSREDYRMSRARLSSYSQMETLDSRSFRIIFGDMMVTAKYGLQAAVAGQESINNLQMLRSELPSAMAPLVKPMIQSLKEVDHLCKKKGTLPGLDPPNEFWLSAVWFSLFEDYESLVKTNGAMDFEEGFMDLVGSPYPPKDEVPTTWTTPNSATPLANSVHQALREIFTEGRKFFTTEKDAWYGIAMPKVEAGDEIVFLFPPWYMPVVLRPIKAEGSDAQHYTMLGPVVLPVRRRQQYLQRLDEEGKLDTADMKWFTID